MKDIQKMIVLSFFNNEETMKFMCNDFFEELKSVTDINLIYSEENINSKTRAKNRKKVEKIITEFLNENKVYYSEIKRLYNSEPLSFIDDIINAFVINYLLEKVDVFKDKRCILYEEFSIIDII